MHISGLIDKYRHKRAIGGKSAQTMVYYMKCLVKYSFLFKLWINHNWYFASNIVYIDDDSHYLTHLNKRIRMLSFKFRSTAGGIYKYVCNKVKMIGIKHGAVCCTMI